MSLSKSVPHPVAAICLGAIFPAAYLANAQAWTPPAGEGSVSIAYQAIDNTGHIRTNGTLVPHGTSEDMSLYLEAGYAFTGHLWLTVGMPYVFAKYTDPNPPPSPIPYLPMDQCHCWQSGWQDLGVTARYSLLQGVFGLTPSLSFGVPSHDYNFRGESALGRDLREMRIGVDAGRRLDAISRNLTVQGGYSYAFVEKVDNISTNRSNARAELSYLLKRRLSVGGQVFWQRTHGGLRFGSPPPATLEFPGEVNTPELFSEHDRILRDNYWRAGPAISYSLPQAEVFAAYTAFVGGSDTHAGRAVTIGFNVPFRVSGKQR